MKVKRNLSEKIGEEEGLKEEKMKKGKGVRGEQSMVWKRSPFSAWKTLRRESRPLVATTMKINLISFQIKKNGRREKEGGKYEGLECRQRRWQEDSHQSSAAACSPPTRTDSPFL